MSDFSSSEDSELSEFSTSDSDIENILEKLSRPKDVIYFEETIPQLSDTVFMEHFRVSKEVANEIAERFSTSDYFKQQSGPHRKVTAVEHTHIFLWFASHETTGFRDVADRFHISISCLHRVLKRMIYFISNMAPEIIQWPNMEQKIEIETHFLQESGFPGVLGVVGGTHIKIDKPQEEPDSYINSKGFFSLHLQLVCDHKLRITDLFTGYPGSEHSTTVFRASPLFESLSEKCVDDDHHILGDSAYPLSVNLLTPFQDWEELNAKQINYNTKLLSNKVTVQRCIGLLKHKWKQLHHIKFRSIVMIANFVRACCVLHNMALSDDFIVNKDCVKLVEPAMDQIQVDEDDENAIQKRNRVVDVLR